MLQRNYLDNEREILVLTYYAEKEKKRNQPYSVDDEFLHLWLATDVFSQSKKQEQMKNSPMAVVADGPVRAVSNPKGLTRE